MGRGESENKILEALTCTEQYLLNFVYNQSKSCNMFTTYNVVPVSPASLLSVGKQATQLTSVVIYNQGYTLKNDT